VGVVVTVFESPQDNTLRITTAEALAGNPFKIAWVEGTAASDERPFSRNFTFNGGGGGMQRATRSLDSFGSIGRYYHRGRFAIQATVRNEKFTFIPQNGFLRLWCSPSDLFKPYRDGPGSLVTATEDDKSHFDRALDQVFYSRAVPSHDPDPLIHFGRISTYQIGWPYCVQVIDIPYWELASATALLPVIWWIMACRRRRRSILLPSLTLLSVLLFTALAAMWVWSYLESEKEWYDQRFPHHGVVLYESPPIFIQPGLPSRGTGPPYYSLHSFGWINWTHHFAYARLIAVGYGWLVVAFAILPSSRVIIWSRRLSHPKPGHCRVCGYDLRATPHRCPECGTVAAMTII
jgi:hypothetical protein